MAFDFPSTPTVGQIYNNYTWDGEKWLLRTAPTNPKKNYILNGAMMVSQENGATAGTSSGYYPVDGFHQQQAGTTGTISAAQVASATPAGSPNRMRYIVTVADAAVAAGDVAFVRAVIEGLRAADLNAGTAGAKAVTIQFGVKAPAGTYCVCIRNALTYNRTYAAEYTIAAGEANTDVVKSVTLVLDTTGTWSKDNANGIDVIWTLMAGTSNQIAANTWTAGTAVGTASQFNFLGTGGNTFELFDVSLTEGSVAPPFVVPDYASELAACQRYYWKFTPGNGAMFANLQAYSAISANGVLFKLPVEMRGDPTIAVSAYGHFNLQPAAGGAAAVSGMTIGTAMRSFAYVAPATASGGGLVAGNATVMQANTAAAWLTFSARL